MSSESFAKFDKYRVVSEKKKTVSLLFDLTSVSNTSLFLINDLEKKKESGSRKRVQGKIEDHTSMTISLVFQS